MPKVTIGDHDVFYVFRRAEESQDALLFVHGAGGTHRHWGEQLTGLRSVNRYVVDLPGHGRSVGQGRTSIAGYADVVLQLLDALDLERVSLVGHSMGGAISQYLALEDPGRVQRLVLVGSGARLRVLPALLDALLTDFPSTVEMMLTWAYSTESPPELLDLAREEWVENDPLVVHGDFAACDAFDVMQRLEEIRCPTLVICGEDDRLTPVKYAHYLRDHIPGATLAIIPHAGHMVMMEQPDQVNRAVEEFLSGGV
jgi:pimeloyl-ACP methyl ester carboxylesterase